MSSDIHLVIALHEKWLCIVLQKFYGRKPKGLNGALQDVGIEFKGRQHSGKTNLVKAAIFVLEDYDIKHVLCWWYIYYIELDKYTDKHCTVIVLGFFIHIRNTLFHVFSFLSI